MMKKITRFATSRIYLAQFGGRSIRIQFEAPGFAEAQEIGRNLFIEEVDRMEGSDNDRETAIQAFDADAEFCPVAAAFDEFCEKDHAPQTGGLYCRFSLTDDSGTPHTVAWECWTLAEVAAASFAIDALQQYARSHNVTFPIGKKAT